MAKAQHPGGYRFGSPEQIAFDMGRTQGGDSGNPFEMGSAQADAFEEGVELGPIILPPPVVP